MNFSAQLALQEEQDRLSEQAYIRADHNVKANKLMDAIFGTRIQKITRQEAKQHYLYRRLDGSPKLA